MPVSVQAVIGARLDSVAPPIRADVAGRRRRRGAVLARRARDGGTTADDVRGALAELARRGLIVRSTDSWFPEQAEYGVQPRARPRGRVRASAAHGARRQARGRRRRGSRRRSASAERSSPTRWPTISSRRCCWPTPRASGREADGWRAARRRPGCRPPATVALRLDPAGAFARNERVLAIDDRGRPAVRARPSPTRRWPDRRSALLGRDEVLRRQQRAVGDPRRERRPGRGGACARVARRTAHGDGPPRGGRRSSRRPPRSCSPASPRRRPELALVHAWMAEDEMFAGQPRSRRRATRSRRWRREPRTSPSRSWRCTSAGTRGSRSATPAGSTTSTRRSIARRRLGRCRRSSRRTAIIADREWQVERAGAALCSGWTRAASWPTVAARSARARGARSRRWSSSTSSAGGTRCSPGPCRSTDDERMDESLVVAVDIWTTVRPAAARAATTATSTSRS